MQKEKKYLWAGIAAAAIVFFKNNKKKEKTIALKAKTLAKSVPKSKNGLLRIQRAFGFVPVSALVEFGTPLSISEKKIFEKWLKEIEKKYGTIQAQNCEKVVYSETSRFTSLLFRATRNVGGILGHDISLYIENINGRNLIRNTKTGKKWSYRVYSDISSGLSDLLDVLKKHNFNLVEYSGGVVNQAYWDKIKTKIIR